MTGGVNTRRTQGPAVQQPRCVVHSGARFCPAMSTATPTPRQQTATCSHCGADRDPHDSVHGSFCSRDCWLAHAGESALRQLRSDHRFCGTCFRRRKHVERPTDDQLRTLPLLVRESFVGFEYPTQYLNRSDGETWCDCGAIDHREGDRTLRHVEGGAVLTNLLQRLWELHESNALDDRAEPGRLFDALRNTEDANLEYAVGAALRGGNDD